MRPGFPIACWLLIAGVFITLTGRESTADDAGVPATATVTEEAAHQGVAATEDSPVIGYDTMALYPFNQIVTRDFDNVTVRELADWIHQEYDVPVELIDATPQGYEDEALTAWADETHFSVESFQQHLYTVLLRARRDIDDYDAHPVFIVRDGVVVFGPRYVFDDDEPYLYPVVHYEVSDLLDGTFDVESLSKILRENTSGEWVEVDGIGGYINHYRGVLIVRQTDHVHDEIAHLLTVLRHPRVPSLRLHGLTDDYQNEQRLKQPITLSLTDVPFDEAIDLLSHAAGVPFRIDESSLTEEGRDVDLPGSLAADNIPAITALDLLFEDYAERIGETNFDVLETYVWDGEIVITAATSNCPWYVYKVLYDVSDFATTQEQQETFNELLMNQTNAWWVDIDGIGGDIQVLEPGWIIVRTDLRVIPQIDDLLAEWRELGLADVSRDRFPAVIQPPWEPTLQTNYYLMHADTAADLLSSLPQRVAPGTWRDADHPEAVGEISMIRLGMLDFTPAAPDSEDAAGDDALTSDVAFQPAEEPSAETIQFPAAVLIIRHETPVLGSVTAELDRLSPDSWSTTGGEFRTQIPIQSVKSVSEFQGGGGGQGFFQMPDEFILE